jgi:hypothetical protein
MGARHLETRHPEAEDRHCVQRTGAYMEVLVDPLEKASMHFKNMYFCGQCLISPFNAQTMHFM